MMDAAHATDLLKRHSVSGIAILFCKAVVAYKSRLQSLTAMSLTEAEDYAAVEAAKLLLYFCHILEELGFLKDGPPPMYINNMASLNIVNENQPTPRCCHIQTQYFALQRWRKLQWLIMQHISSVINSPDALTKALPWVLHHCHNRRMMGHVISSPSV